METFRKRYGSTLAWIFSTKTIFLTNFERFLNTRRANPFLCPPSPIYRRKERGGCRPARPSELGCFHQKAPPSFGTLRKAQVGLVAFCTPFSLNTSPFCVFFIDFFLKRCGTLWITQRHLFSFRNVAKFYG